MGRRTIGLRRGLARGLLLSILQMDLPLDSARRSRGALAASELFDLLAFGGLVAFVACLYTSLALWIPATAIVRPALAASTAAAAGTLVYLWAGDRAPRFDGLRGLALLGFCALTALSIRWSLAPKISLASAVETAKEGFIYLLILQIVRSAPRLRVLCGAVALAAAVPAFGALQNYVNGTDLLGGTRARWVGVFSDPNHLAMALVSAVPLALLFVAEGPGIWRRILFGASALACVAGVVVTQSRGGAVGLGAAVLAFALTRRRVGRGLAIAALLVVALLAFAPGTFWSRTGSLAEYQTDLSAQGRVHAWQVLYRVAVDRPFTGTGAGAFLAAWPLYAPIEAGRHAFVTHNVFFQPLADLGLGGFAIFLALIASCLAATFAGRRSVRVGSLSAALFAALIGNLVCQLSSGYSSNTFLFLLLALGAAADGLARAERAGLPTEAAPAASPARRLQWE